MVLNLEGGNEGGTHCAIEPEFNLTVTCNVFDFNHLNIIIFQTASLMF